MLVASPTLPTSLADPAAKVEGALVDRHLRCVLSEDNSDQALAPVSPSSFRGGFLHSLKQLVRRQPLASYSVSVDKNAGAGAFVIPAERLVVFAPTDLGGMAGDYRSLLSSLEGARQSEMRDALLAAARRVKGDAGNSGLAFRTTVLMLRDYIAAGYYPIIQDSQVLLAPLVEAANLDEDQRRATLRAMYEATRLRALVDRGARESLAQVQTVVRVSDSKPVVEGLKRGDGLGVALQDVRNDDSARMLWRAVRATWSMAPDASAPGREVSLLVVDEQHPDVPIGIVQFRNVVPEIRARDLWLGIVSVDPSASERPVDQQRGLVGELARRGDPKELLRETRGVLERLLRCVRPGGLPACQRGGRPWSYGAIDDMVALASQERTAWNMARREGYSQAAIHHLAVTKRAETATDLLRGLEGIRRLTASSDPVQMLRTEEGTRRLVDAGLRKIWHYHMGFVALEMSVCGAAPPFNALRVGKLMAALAGSDEAIGAWGGAERPLGQIAHTVYQPEVRELIPNPGPIVIFTSGLYPGHSAQYNRVDVGGQRWRKLGDTQGYGSSHVSAATVAAADAYNQAADGYTHISRSFGEGASARFRTIGRSLTRLGLPDLRRHDIRRPLYALPLIEDVPGTLLGWSPVPESIARPKASELTTQWWDRWVAPSAEKLIADTAVAATLADSVAALIRRIDAEE